jgi:RecA-family ATPase
MTLEQPPTNEKPWTTDPTYGGMSDASAGKSWRAAHRNSSVVELGAAPYKFEFVSSRRSETIPERKDNTAPPIFATPYIWKDPATLPCREWLYGDLLIRKFVTTTVAPGGVGKSSLGAVESLAQVSGKDLLGVCPPRRLRVWLWNLEDPQEETERKIQAAAMHYGVTAEDIGYRWWSQPIDATLYLREKRWSV